MMHLLQPTSLWGCELKDKWPLWGPFKQWHCFFPYPIWVPICKEIAWPFLCISLYGLFIYGHPIQKNFEIVESSLQKCVHLRRRNIMWKQFKIRRLSISALVWHRQRLCLLSNLASSFSSIFSDGLWERPCCMNKKRSSKRWLCYEVKMTIASKGLSDRPYVPAVNNIGNSIATQVNGTISTLFTNNKYGFYWCDVINTN